MVITMDLAHVLFIGFGFLIGWQILKLAARQAKHDFEVWLRKLNRQHGTQTKRVYHRQPSNGQPKSGTPWEEFPEAWTSTEAAK